MNDEIRNAILNKIPELNPKDPRSIHYKRILNQNNNLGTEVFLFILKSCILIFFLLIFKKIFFDKNDIVFQLIALFTIAIYSYKNFVILSIKSYQNFAKKSVRNRCRFEPSCSNYSIQALNKYGAFKGTILMIKRLYRCSYTDDAGFEELRNN